MLTANSNDLLRGCTDTQHLESIMSALDDTKQDGGAANSASASSSSPPAASLPPVTFPIRLLSVRSSYIAKSNHFTSSDPLVVFACDNRPLFKTSIRVNSPQCSWDLTQRDNVQPVPGGLVLSEGAGGAAAAAAAAAADAPTLLVDVSTLATTRLQVRQEDFSKSRGEDDLGGFSIPIEQIIDKAWRQEKAIVPPADASAASAASSIASAASASAAPPSPSMSSASSSTVAAEGGWYPVSIDSAPLLDRVSSRHLGDVSLKLSVQLEPYLRYLVASQTNLHLLAELVACWMDSSASSSSAAADTPLRHLLLDQTSLAQLVGFIVVSACDKGSMDGQRLRERLYPMLHKSLDVFGAAQVLPLWFGSDCAVWRGLFSLRQCVPMGCLPSSSGGWALYAGLVESFLNLADRATQVLEPPPPPPVKTPEEIEAERLVEEAAEKKRQIKARKAAKAAAAAAAAAGEDGGEDEPPLSARGSSAGSALSSPSNASKKKKSSSSSLPEPPPLPPSTLSFGLASLPILREMFQATHVRLGGSSRRASAIEVDWASASETKLGELAACVDLLWRVHTFLLRYGDADGSRPTVDDLRPVLFGVSGGGGVGGDPHALWLQKVLASIVKKSRDTLVDNRDLLAKLQQHADRFAKNYPVEPKPKKTKQ